MLEKAKLIKNMQKAYKYFVETKDAMKFISFIKYNNFKIVMFDSFFYELRLLNNKYEIFFSLADDYIEISDFDKHKNQVIAHESLKLMDINQTEVDSSVYKLLFDYINQYTK